MIKNTLLPRLPPPPEDKMGSSHLPNPVKPNHFDFGDFTAPSSINPTHFDFGEIHLPNHNGPSFEMDFHFGANENLKFLGVDNYIPPAGENTVYHEFGLKGMTEKDLFIQRFQAENGEPTQLEAKLNAKENNTSPYEEFMKLYNKSTTEDDDPSGDLGGSKIVIAPAIDTEDDEEEKDAKKIAGRAISDFIISSKKGKKEEVIISEDEKNRIVNNIDEISTYQHKDLDALIAHIPKTSLPKGLSKYTKDEKRELIKNHFERNKGIENPEKMPFEEKRELFEDKK